MKPTDEEIEKFAAQDMDLDNYADCMQKHGRIEGAKWARDQQPNWISVNDQLPEDRITVIVGWIGTGDEHVTTGYYHEQTKSWYPAHPAPYTIPVTEWMPIPALQASNSPKPTTNEG